MRVRAKGTEGVVVGYYNHQRRRGGDVFTLKDPKHFSKIYMEKLGKEEPKKEGFDREGTKAKLVELGVDFAGNAKNETLATLLAEAEADKQD